MSEQLDLPVLITAAHGRILYANRAARLLFELDASPPTHVPSFLSALLGCAAGDFSLTLAAPDGERFYRASISQRDEDPDARDTTALITFQDQTEQVHLARKLVEGDDRLQAVGQAAEDVILIADNDQRIVFANAATEWILGWPIDEILGCAVPEALGPGIVDELAALATTTTTGRKATRIDLSICRRDGRPIDIELSLNRFRAERSWKTLLILRDITHRLVRQRKLEEAEARWHFALEGSGDGVWDWDITTGEIAFSKRFKSMLGYNDESFSDDYSSWEDKIHPDDMPRVRSQLEGYLDGRRDQYACELRIRKRTGEYMWVLDRGLIVARDGDGRPLRMVGTQRDIDEGIKSTESLRQQLVETLDLNQKLEDAQVQLVQTEKMAVIGQLAAGVAHEMNTPLGYVSSNLNTLEGYARDLLRLIQVFHAGIERAPAQASDFAEAKALCQQVDLSFIEEDLPNLLSETREGLDRVLRIVRDLRDFSRPGEQEWQSVNLHGGLDSTLNILHNQLKHNVTVVREYGDLPAVWCIPSQINQVFLNLLNNARQAIRERGTITVRTRRDGRHAIIDIEDSGDGMSEEQLRHIFEPFYTTKPTGEGTGLGLSLSLDIIQRHSGTLSATSAVGVGSAFRVRLPIGEGKNNANGDDKAVAP